MMPDQTWSGWIDIAREYLVSKGAVVRASLVSVKGSAPREAGASMLITSDEIWQTIGGGSLEFEVMRRAREMLAEPGGSWPRQVIHAALGPDMGQCCGGQVKVLLERFGPDQDQTLAALADCRAVMHPLDGDQTLSDAGDASIGLARAGKAFVAPVAVPARPVFLYGAGHVGRALAPHLVALGLDLHWVDVTADRFPMVIPPGARRVVAADPALIAAHAPAESLHLVITHNHDLDEAICHRILSDGEFARLGLIGSATKSARFRSRLGKAGIDADALDRLVCPVGLSAITGKHPARVALSIAAGVAIWQQELDEIG